MSDRLGTVLFADVSGSTSLYETAGDSAALEAISTCLGAARAATEAWGGRVVKTMGDEVMSIFPGPDAAANAAADIQVRIDALPALAGKKLGVRIGFHHGPVLQRDDDVFGDTVNLAARIGRSDESRSARAVLIQQALELRARFPDANHRSRVQGIERLLIDFDQLRCKRHGM